MTHSSPKSRLTMHFKIFLIHFDGNLPIYGHISQLQQFIKPNQEFNQKDSNMETNLLFNHHRPITSKANSAKRILGSKKYTLHKVPEAAKPLAYTSLCLPIFECADVLSDEKEAVKSKAVRLIKNITW